MASAAFMIAKSLHLAAAGDPNAITERPTEKDFPFAHVLGWSAKCANPAKWRYRSEQIQVGGKPSP